MVELIPKILFFQTMVMLHYQIKGNGTHNSMLANGMPFYKSWTPGVGSKIIVFLFRKESFSMSK